MQEWGVDPTKEIPPSPATTKYTDFLLATAAGKVDGGKGSDKMVTPFEKTKIAAYTVGAITPCMRLYAYLGKELTAFLKQELEVDDAMEKTCLGSFIGAGNGETVSTMLQWGVRSCDFVEFKGRRGRRAL